MDYGVQFSKLMYEASFVEEILHLFSPSDVPGLMKLFSTIKKSLNTCMKKQKFIQIFVRKQLPAIRLFSSFMEERKNTGRIYLMNVDHANTHSSFDEKVAPVHQSNLCCEINLPTKPLSSFDSDEGEIALCTLSAINWGKINKPSDFAKPCELLFVV